MESEPTPGVICYQKDDSDMNQLEGCKNCQLVLSFFKQQKITLLYHSHYRTTGFTLRKRSLQTRHSNSTKLPHQPTTNSLSYQSLPPQYWRRGSYLSRHLEKGLRRVLVSVSDTHDYATVFDSAFGISKPGWSIGCGYRKRVSIGLPEICEEGKRMDLEVCKWKRRTSWWW